MGGKYVLPFRFRRPNGTRTSHHLVFVSKHQRGYGIMKDIMARESSTESQGVPSFEYNLAIRHQGLLFELSRPLDDLGDMLLDEFAGKTLTMGKIFDSHNYNRPFIKKNYKAVLAALEAEERIRCSPSADKRRRGTFADRVKLSFPRKGKRNG